MCNLDIIAGNDPIIYTQEEAWSNWFFSMLHHPVYGILFLLFGALFLITVSLLALFVVRLLKNNQPKAEVPAADADGSVHWIPVLLSAFASAMLMIAVLLLLGFIILNVLHGNRFTLKYLPYGWIALYIIIMTLQFTVTLRFSPKASKLFLGWNRFGQRCGTVALLILAILCGFYWCMYWLLW